jgi:ketosteroid isomerase-like protein
MALKPKVLSLVLVLISFGCSTKDSGRLSPQQVVQIENEIKATIDNWIAKWPNFDVESIFQYYCPDFVGFGPWADKFDVQKYKKVVIDLFNSMNAYKWTTYRQDFLVVNKDIVICTMDGKDELFMKSGDKITFDPAHYTFGLRKVAGQWKFFYHHSSGVQVTQKAEKK